jgi:A nuclease family of the HNH/ENDO VII superfamily with conserved AHH
VTTTAVETAGTRPATPAPAPAPTPAPAPAPAAPTPGAAAPGRPAGPGAGPAPGALGNAAAARAAPLPAGSVSLAAETLELSDEVAAGVTTRPQKIPVHVGTYARGEIAVFRQGEGYRTPEPQFIPLLHPGLEPLRAAGLEPNLRISISRSGITGAATIGRGGAESLAAALKEHQQALGWVGIDLGRVPTPKNELGPEGLTFILPALPFTIGRLLEGSLKFGVVGETVVFEGKATLRVAGQQGSAQVTRDERGGMAIVGDLAVKLGAVAATLHASLDSTGNFDVRGKARYQAEKFNGEITIVVADERVAEQLAREQLGIEDAEKPVPAEGGAAKAARSRLTRPVAVGWGVLDFAVSDWLAGTAKVVIEPAGHLTVIGDITPPAEVELFKQRDYVQHLFKLEARATYGIPVVGNVFVFANIGMDALAKLGPGKLHQIKLEGKYSTNPDIARAFSIQGTITISAFAGLRLRAEGGAGLEVLDHDIKVGVGLDGLAGVRGYVEATPKIGMREVGEPATRKTEFYIQGHLEIAAQPFLGLSGDLFVELDSPWWSPAPDKKWTWPIGSLEYPLPGEVGIGADVDYVLGSPNLPEITFGRPSFDSSKFITDLVNDHVPPKSKGEQEKPGAWKEGEEGKGEAPGGGVPTEGGAAPPGVPAPAPAAGAGGRDESGQPAPKTATPGAHPPVDGKEGVPAPEAEERWEAGLQELSQLASRAESDPLSQAEIIPALALIKERYGFTRLEAQPDAGGEQWTVEAELNPKTVKKMPLEQPSSRKLGRRMEEDEERPGGTAAHHIVAGTDPRAAPARKVLKDHGIGINDAVNGVFLPRFESSPNPDGAAVHASVHTDRYYAEVNSIVFAARSSKEDVIDALLLIRLALLEDIFAK